MKKKKKKPIRKTPIKKNQKANLKNQQKKPLRKKIN